MTHKQLSLRHIIAYVDKFIRGFIDFCNFYEHVRSSRGDSAIGFRHKPLTYTMSSLIMLNQQGITSELV